MKKPYFLLAGSLYVCAVLYLAITTPISPHEAKIFYTSDNLLSILMHQGDTFLGGFIGLRFFFILSGFLTILLFYALSRGHFDTREDAYLATVLFMFLPGILTASTLVNIAILVLPLVLLFVLMYERGKFWILPLIMLALFFIHEASIIFFVALLLYALVYKDKKLGISSAAFLIAFIFLSKGIKIGGGPSGHFIEIFGLYASVFSPLLFLFFFYAMYRILLREKKSLLWYISFTALAFSLLLSIRQRIHITDFAPYVMISVILMLDVFNRSVRVRLPEFQKQYKRAFYTVIFFLGVSASIIILHQITYTLSSNSDKHFAKRIYGPYLLAKRLKEDKVPCYKGARGRERYQLRYYGILLCSNY
ncbi:MAG: hypothetical protein U9O64_01155 [Campylobacterota bacterium]|nr:hypothetical protein [Campylobacterota bacterium]